MPAPDTTIEAVFLLLQQISARVERFDDRLTAHMEEEEEERKDLMDEVRSLRVLIEAFPHTTDGVPDVSGHRNYHEEEMKSRRSTSDLKDAAKKRAVDIIVTAIFALLAIGFLGWVRGGL